jgi:hypothetical protein
MMSIEARSTRARQCGINNYCKVTSFCRAIWLLRLTAARDVCPNDEKATSGHDSLPACSRHMLSSEKFISIYGSDFDLAACIAQSVRVTGRSWAISLQDM